MRTVVPHTVNFLFVEPFLVDEGVLEVIVLLVDFFSLVIQLFDFLLKDFYVIEYVPLEYLSDYIYSLWALMRFLLSDITLLYFSSCSNSK